MPCPVAAYVDMISAAIKALKERTGSSLPAIKKYIGATYGSKLPANWEKTLSVQLKRLAAAGKLTKVKASFKLGEELKKPAKVGGPLGTARCTRGDWVPYAANGKCEGEQGRQLGLWVAECRAAAKS